MTETKIGKCQVPKLHQLALHSEISRYESPLESLRTKSAITDRTHNTRQNSLTHGFKVSPRIHRLKESPRICPLNITEFQTRDEASATNRTKSDSKGAVINELRNESGKIRDRTATKPPIVPQVKYKDIIQKIELKHPTREDISLKEIVPISNRDDPEILMKNPPNFQLRRSSRSSSQENGDNGENDKKAQSGSKTKLLNHHSDSIMDITLDSIENDKFHGDVPNYRTIETFHVTPINDPISQRILSVGKENSDIDACSRTIEDPIASYYCTRKSFTKQPQLQISSDFSHKNAHPSLNLNMEFTKELKMDIIPNKMHSVRKQSIVSTLDTNQEQNLSQRVLKTERFENVLSRITVDDSATINSNNSRKSFLLNNCLYSTNRQDQNSTQYSVNRTVSKFETRETNEQDLETQFDESDNIFLEDKCWCCKARDFGCANNKHQKANFLTRLQEVQAINLEYKNTIQKLKIQHSRQEKEIGFLKHAKERLEKNIENLISVSGGPEFYVKKLETVLGERDNQLKEASVSLEMANTELRELQKKYRDEKKFQEEILTNLQEKNQRLEAEMIATKEYSNIETQIHELEKMQNALVDENNTLKKLNDELRQENNLLKLKFSLQNTRILEGKGKDTWVSSNVFTEVLEGTFKLNDIEDFSSKLVRIIKAIIDGEEPPIELILKHNRSSQGKKVFEPQQTDHANKHFLQIIKENSLTIKKIYKSHQMCMDAICDLYATKYRNNCTIQ